MMISVLPDDLESEILSRVPAKSLARLKTTCKRWYALFRDPKFVKNNNLGKAASKEVMLLSNFGVYSISGDLHGIPNRVDPSIEFTGKPSSLKDSKDLKICGIFHCDGLVLCTTKGNTRLVIWNPCTGQTRRIKPRTCHRSDEDLYALGYENSKSSCHSHSYKIFRFCHSYNDQKRRVEIYEFSSDSWRVLDDITWGICSGGVSLKGNTYWIGGEKETGFFLLDFDFTTERFGRLPLPYQILDYGDIPILSIVISVVREEKLSLLTQHLLTSSLEMKIWVTNKFDEAKDLSWSNVFVVDFVKVNLTSVMRVTSFFLDEENKVAVCCDTDMHDEDRTRISIFGEDIHKQVYKEITMGFYLNWPLLVSYVPNLVHIQKNTPKGKKKMKAKEDVLQVRTGCQLCKIL